jgi:hypothetical protein
MKRLLLVGLLLCAMGTAVVVGMTPQAAAQDVFVQPVTVQRTYTLYGPTAVTTSTVNTASPNLDTYNRDMAVTTGFGTADVFVTVDGTGTFTATSTVQVSADGVNWATADYEYATDSAIATQSFARTQTADGTEYMRVPLAGERLRVQIAVTGAVTPTVWVTYRN